MSDLVSPRDKPVSPRDKPVSPREKPGSARDSVATSVKISRRDLRRMSEEEVSQRLSARRMSDDHTLPAGRPILLTHY